MATFESFISPILLLDWLAAFSIWRYHCHFYYKVMYWGRLCAGKGDFQLFLEWIEKVTLEGVHSCNCVCVCVCVCVCACVCVRACVGGEELNPSIPKTSGFGMPSTQHLPYLTSEKRSQIILQNSRYSVNKGLSIRSSDMSILSFLGLNIDFYLMKWNLTLMMIISFI